MRNLTTSRRWLLGVLLASLLGIGVAAALTNRAAQAGSSELELLRSPQMGSAHFGLNWSVVGSGGGEISSTHFRVRSTMGQPAVGWKSSTHFKEHSGYWQTFIRRVFLPLVLRNYS